MHRTDDSGSRTTASSLRVRALVAASWAALAASGLAAQAGQGEVDALRARVERARATAVHLLAPRTFQAALDRYEDAAERLKRGRVDEGFRERVAEARLRLDDAERRAEAARQLFGDALAARQRAVAAEASARAGTAWQSAENELAEGGRRVERGDAEEGRAYGRRAADLYDRAAIAAWRDRHLGAAIAARERAIATGARELAPQFFAAGERALATGEAEIAAGRTGDRPAAAGAEAAAAFERAGAVSILADSIMRRNVTVERLVRAHEADLASLLEVAQLDAAPTETARMTTLLADEIRRLRSEVARLSGQLADERATSGQLADRVAALESQLGETERRFTDAREELVERRRREERLTETQALFTPREGEVLQAGDRLVLRLFGLTFASGSADIAPEHDPLLTKVQRVITDFPNAAIRIEGHTDSQGSAEANRALSQRRANAVREYLLSRMAISSARVESVGLGEDQPIASNETEAGRAQNRRIEVVLTLSG